MPDLSTPLLDSINSKLADPNLDCETMANTEGEGDRIVTTTGATGGFAIRVYIRSKAFELQ